MKKTTKQIAEDCECDYGLLEDVMEENFQSDHPLEKELCDTIGALYRRIEKLETEPDLKKILDAEDYSWIKVRQPCHNMTLDEMHEHHSKETEFLIGLCRKLGRRIEKLEVAIERILCLTKEASDELDQVRMEEGREQPEDLTNELIEVIWPRLDAETHTKSDINDAVCNVLDSHEPKGEGA